jgi:hypothetical protein
MGLTAIDPVPGNNTLALRHMHTTVHTSDHFLWRRLMSRNVSPRVLPLGPQPPDYRQERKQKQVFHRFSRIQKGFENP